MLRVEGRGRGGEWEVIEGDEYRVEEGGRGIVAESRRRGSAECSTRAIV